MLSDLSKPVEPSRLAREIVKWLNRGRRPAIFGESDTYCRTHLRRYVETWIEADYKLDAWPLRETLENLIRYQTFSLSQHNGQPRLTSSFGHFDPDEVIVSGDDYEPPSEVDDHNEEAEEFREGIEDYIRDQVGLQEASEIFLRFMTGSQYQIIGRCARCQKFYANAWNHSDKKYCSQRCASADTAVRATQRRREELRQDKIRRIKNALEKYCALSSEERQSIASQQGGGKKWVARKAGRDIKANFITRNIQTLNIPKKLESELLREGAKR